MRYLKSEPSGLDAALGDDARSRFPPPWRDLQGLPKDYRYKLLKRPIWCAG